ncbi:hypothetical protein EJD97_018484 [Solanum chilense]|uniref:Uncharacterized protein n=1 Tax=Solanum chilense TaxID=4083 RepID=A0A6N2AHF6_SOLCI|nr:hypothetical protein EJD97_018484 [Solanum chilense]
MAHISDIKLIRTDTTLDLSQKAEKGMPNYVTDSDDSSIVWLEEISFLGLAIVITIKFIRASDARNREYAPIYLSPLYATELKLVT